MTFLPTLEQISTVTSAILHNVKDENLKKHIKGISTDTRNLKSGELFVALKGDNFDGHNFAQKAMEKGAIAVITAQNNALTVDENIPQLIVENTLNTYQKIAHYWKNLFSIPIIGVTGSVGKTTTKELISAVLETKGKVLKTTANYNNEIGVPKTLLNLDESYDYAVIEMAMRGSGEIALLAEIANPNIGVITNVGTAHIGRLGSRLAIAQAKCELLEKMDSSGVAILNYDCPLLIETASKVWSGKTITYGLTGGDLQGEIINDNTLKVDNKMFPLPLKGEHNALNYLAAIAVAKVLELDLSILEKSINVSLPDGRSKHYQLSGDVEILDETYNAGFESMKVALKLLKNTPGKRKIAVLGTMKELGEYSSELHFQVGQTVQELNIDCLFILDNDPECQEIVKGVISVYTEIFTNCKDLVKKLLDEVKKGDRILFKASNSVGLNHVVKDFKESWEEKK